MNAKLEWQRAMTTLAAVTVFVVVVAAIYWARSIFIPLALAVFLAFVLATPVAWMQRRGLGRLPAVLGSVGLSVLLVVVVGGIVSWQLTELTNTLPEYTPRITEKLKSLRAGFPVDGESRIEAMVNEVTAVFVPPKRDQAGPKVIVETQGDSWFTQARTYFGPASEVVGQIAFGFVLSVFMLLKREDLRNRLIRLTGDTQLTTTTKAVDDASTRISRYLFAQLILNTGFGIVIAAGLLAIGVPYALLWGVLAWLMRYVPYLGTWIGLIPPVIVSAITSDGWWQPIAVVAMYGTLELLCNNVLEPWLYGRSTGMSEVAQLVAAAFWAFLWGPIGLVLSGPLTVCLLILGKYVPRFSFFEILIGDEPVLTPDVRFYQRLTARDQDEASSIAEEQLKTGSPDQLFDTVIVPALSHAKEDFENESLSTEELASILSLTREIVYEIDQNLQDPVDENNDQTTQASESRIKLLAIPAKDEADEVALEMFRALMDESKWEIEVAQAESLTSELVERIRTFQPAVILIGALPPGGHAHTRYVCKRARREFPSAMVMIGRWGLTEDVPANREQLLAAGADYVGTSLTDMKQHLGGWMGVLSESKSEPTQKRPRKSTASEPVGTGAASHSTA